MDRLDIDLGLRGDQWQNVQDTDPGQSLAGEETGQSQPGQSRQQLQQDQKQQQLKQQQDLQYLTDLSLPPPYYEVATSVPTAQYFLQQKQLQQQQPQQQQPQQQQQQPLQQQQPIFAVIPGPAPATVVNGCNNIAFAVLNRMIGRTIGLAIIVMLKCGIIFRLIALILTMKASTRLSQRRFIEAQSFAKASRWVSLAGIIVGTITMAVVLGIFCTSNSLITTA